jgi:hypothetical protein
MKITLKQNIITVALFCAVAFTAAIARAARNCASKASSCF